MYLLERLRDQLAMRIYCILFLASGERRIEDDIAVLADGFIFLDANKKPVGSIYEHIIEITCHMYRHRPKRPWATATDQPATYR